MPVRLHVNVDHVATVRNARGTPYPDPVFAAQICEQAGADGITAHLREDRRHIRDEDVARLRATLTTALNLEMAATAEMIAIAEKTRPDVITLVPERREERTTEGGLDLDAAEGAIRDALTMAHEQAIRTSLFIAPEIAAVEKAKALGADQVELHTGDYCHHPTKKQLDRLRAATARGVELGLDVAAGHGLTRHNLMSVIAIDGVSEVNIGHALVSDAIFVGLSSSVRDYHKAIERGLKLRGR